MNTMPVNSPGASAGRFRSVSRALQFTSVDVPLTMIGAGLEPQPGSSSVAGGSRNSQPSGEDWVRFNLSY